MSEKDLPEYTRVVVIGGGIIGCSVAYHLAEMGCRDVVLLERDQLTSGTTWHAAGLMTTFGSGSETTLGIRKHSMELYKRLEEETGQETGFKGVGFIEVASNEDRLEEYRRIAAFNRLHGVDIHELSAAEVKELFPFAEVDNISGGFLAEHDGRINPVDVTMALAAGARSIKPPHDIFWGGFIAYVADPDGHVWEFAHNPFSPLGPNGEFQWNGAA